CACAASREPGRGRCLDAAWRRVVATTGSLWRIIERLATPTPELIVGFGPSMRCFFWSNRSERPSPILARMISAKTVLGAAGAYLKDNPEELLRAAKNAVALRFGVPIPALRWLAGRANG